MQSLQAASTVIGFLSNARNAFIVVQDQLKSRGGAGDAEDGAIAEAMALVLGLQKPFWLCVALQNRQETIGYVSSPVWFTRRVLRRYEEFSAKHHADEDDDDDDEEDARESVASTDVARELESLVRDLKTCVQLLTLALTSVQVTTAWDPAAEVPTSEEAKVIAKTCLRRFETEALSGFRIASGELHEWRISSVARSSSSSNRQHDLVCLGMCAVYVERGGGQGEGEGEGGASLALVVTDENEHEGDADETASASDQQKVVLALDQSFRIRQERKGDIDDGILVGGESFDFAMEAQHIAYEIRAKDDPKGPIKTWHLVFESFGHYSCQTFEEILRSLAGSARKAPSLSGADADVDNISERLQRQAFHTP